MFLYLQYEGYRRKYIAAQQKYDELLSEKEALFERTQPGAVIYDKERVSSGTSSNKFDDYVIAKERTQIDERLDEARQILDEREQLLKRCEKDLRDSTNVYDKVYCLRYLDRLRIYKVANAVHYSEAQVYRILRDISESLKRDRK